MSYAEPTKNSNKINHNKSNHYWLPQVHRQWETKFHDGCYMCWGWCWTLFLFVWVCVVHIQPIVIEIQASQQIIWEEVNHVIKVIIYCIMCTNDKMMLRSESIRLIVLWKPRENISKWINNIHLQNSEKKFLQMKFLDFWANLSHPCYSYIRREFRVDGLGVCVS